MKIYKTGIACILEILWNGSGVSKKNEYTVFYSCQDKELKLGTGIVVSKRVMHTVMHSEEYQDSAKDKRENSSRVTLYREDF
jgi:hypothetical protein